MTKKKDEETTAVATTGKGSVVPFDYGDDAGAGVGQDSASDITIPFINILQSLSPEVTKKTIDGATPGLIYNNVTKELFDGEEGVYFQPCFKHGCFVEWVPRNKGGGFVAIHERGSAFVTKHHPGGRLTGPIQIGKLDKEGKGETELVETVYVYGLVYDTDMNYRGFGVISFTSTKLKVWREWNTGMKSMKFAPDNQPPLYAHVSRFRTFLDTNRANQEYYNFRVGPRRESYLASLLNPGDESDREMLRAGREFHDMVSSGIAKADYAAGQESDSTDADEIF